MKKILLILIPTVLILAGVIFSSNRLKLEEKAVENTSTISQEITPTFSQYTARFEIYTNGTKRIFTASMYHNLSNEVFISSPDPNVVRVNKPSITWNDFFRTLPFELTESCLTTGTGQKFCTNQKQSLKFYLNGVKKEAVLQKEIAPDDFLKIVYE